MKDCYDVIVVGGGLAGLTAAAYCCRHGIDVALFEKSFATGGLVKSFTNQGFTFDAGIRAFENSGILLPMLKQLGINMDLATQDVSIGLVDTWTTLHSKDDLYHYQAMLTTHFPEEEGAIKDIVSCISDVSNYMDVIYGIDNPLFRDDLKDSHYLKKTLLPWLMKYQINIRKATRMKAPIREHLHQFTSNEALIDTIIQHFFTDTPAFFALSYFGLYLDYFYPKGGTGVLASKVHEYIIEHGGKIFCQTTVGHIDNINKHVHLENGKHVKYKKLIWAADQRSLYTLLETKQNKKVETTKAKVLQSLAAESILSVYIAADIDPQTIKAISGPHAFYTATVDGLSKIGSWQYTKDLNAYVESFLTHTTYEISCPALRDETLAPPGQTGFIVSTLFDYNLVKKICDENAYEAFKDLVTKKVIDVLNESIYPKLKENVIFAHCSTPFTLERETRNFAGSITGWSFTNKDLPSETNFKKILKSIHTPMEDIYQAGQWTFSPSGLPVAILTGKVTADAVHKSLQGERRV